MDRVDKNTSYKPTNQRAELHGVKHALKISTMIYNWVKLRGKPKFIVIRNMLFKVLMNGPVIGQKNGWKNSKGETVANKDLIQETVALKIVLTKLIKIKIGEIWNLFMLKVMLVILVMKLLIDWQIKELINMARGRHFLVIKCLYMHICTETKIDKIFIYYSTTNIIIFVYLFYLCYLKRPKNSSLFQ